MLYVCQSDESALKKKRLLTLVVEGRLPGQVLGVQHPADGVEADQRLVEAVETTRERCVDLYIEARDWAHTQRKIEDK